MQDNFEGVEVCMVNTDDHVEEIKRDMQEVQEGIIGLVQVFPFRGMPRLIVRKIVELAERNLIYFP